MHLSQDIKPISYLKAKTADVINSVNENQRTIIITQNGEAKAVVQDIKTYENLQNSLNLLKLIVQSENDIENNEVLEQDKMFENLEQKLFGQFNIAKKIFFEIKKECANLHYFPQRKRVVPELQQIGILKYREIIHERWRIIFKIDNTKVYVLLVVDSRRNLEDILFQRLIDKK